MVLNILKIVVFPIYNLFFKYKNSILSKEGWRNGSASASRAEGWVFESLTLHFALFLGYKIKIY